MSSWGSYQSCHDLFGNWVSEGRTELNKMKTLPEILFINLFRKRVYSGKISLGSEGCQKLNFYLLLCIVESLRVGEFYFKLPNSMPEKKSCQAVKSSF